MRIAGVGMVVRECSVHLFEQWQHVGANVAQHVSRAHSANAVAAIDDNTQWAIQLDVTGNTFTILLQDVFVLDLSFTRANILLDNAPVNVLYLGPVKSIARHHDFEPVVIGGIVAAGNHHARSLCQFMGCKIQHPGRHGANIQNVTTAGGYAFDHALYQLGA